MASPIVRPKYTEGQVLAAADLEAQVTYSRIDSAIHERTEHIWGIAKGLTLELRDPQVGANNTPYGQPTIAIGVAVDASGRRIVVTEERQITAREFRNAGVWSSGDPKETKYPIYLVAIEEPVVSGRSGGRCGVDAATRTAESFQIEIGRPGTERAVNAPTTEAPIGSGPGTGGKVLVGLVTWDQTVIAGGGFTSVLHGPAHGIRYVGVRASTVIPHAGKLVLATGDDDPRFVVELSQDDQGKAELRFGRQTGTAPVSGLFVVNDRGDVTIAGKITSPIPQLPMSMAGSISHGLRLPLPPAVTDDLVADGRVTLQYLISPHQAKADKLFNGLLREALPTPIECWVNPDPEDRRVTCRVQWRTTTAPFRTRSEAGTADYLLIVTPKGTP